MLQIPFHLLRTQYSRAVVSLLLFVAFGLLGTIVHSSTSLAARQSVGANIELAPSDNLDRKAGREVHNGTENIIRQQPQKRVHDPELDWLLTQEHSFDFDDNRMPAANPPAGNAISLLAPTPPFVCSYFDAPPNPSPAFYSSNLCEPYNDLLGSKTPVILIHGIHGNQRKGDQADLAAEPYEGYFSNLIQHLNKDTTNYRQRYKTYTFHYESDKYSARDISWALDDRIRRTFGNTRQIVLVAHSMGGIVARQFMEYRYPTGNGGSIGAGDRVKKLITLGTPHHGTQLANRDARTGLFGNSGNSSGSILRGLDFVYWNYMVRCSLCVNSTLKKNRSTLLWDNYDGSWRNNTLYSEPEKNTDLPTNAYGSQKIIAYYGETDTNAPSFRKVKEAIQSGITNPQRLLSKFKGPDTEAFGLSVLSLVLQGIKEKNFNNLLNKIPANDGMVPIESGGFFSNDPRGDNVSKRVLCKGYNHKDLRDFVINK